MIEDNRYKVLWVEDTQSIIKGYQSIASGFNLKLEVFPSWEEAEENLRLYFNEYSAIILDAHCKFHKEPTSVADNLFLGQVSIRLSRIFGEKQKFIPWYVLSAGTMDYFDVVLDLINTEERKKFDEHWGPLAYIKSTQVMIGEQEIDAEEYLFSNIQKVAEETGINTVLYRYANVFKFLGEGRLINYVQARRYMLKMLSTLYYPEENINYVYEGNPLRKVLEYIFRTSHKYGLLPDEFIKPGGRIELLDSSRYMGGVNATLDIKNNTKTLIRFGEPGIGKEGSGGERIFNEEISMFVKNILNYSNSDSHTNEDEPYCIEEERKEVFFSYVLQLCEVIKYIAEYIETHPDTEKNKEKINIITLDSSEKRSSSPKKETKKDKKESMSQTPIPSMESLEGQEVVIIRLATTLTCGAYCKLDLKYKNDVGKKIKIKSLCPNTDDDLNEIPYSVQEFEFV